MGTAGLYKTACMIYQETETPTRLYLDILAHPSVVLNTEYAHAARTDGPAPDGNWLLDTHQRHTSAPPVHTVSLVHLCVRHVYQVRTHRITNQLSALNAPLDKAAVPGPRSAQIAVLAPCPTPGPARARRVVLELLLTISERVRAFNVALERSRHPGRTRARFACLGPFPRHQGRPPVPHAPRARMRVDQGCLRARCVKQAHTIRIPARIFQWS